jgi:hypothetical protein
VELLTLSQVADDIGLSRQRVSQLAKARILKTIQILGRPAVKAADLEAFKQLDRRTGRPKNGAARAKKSGKG